MEHGKGAAEEKEKEKVEEEGRRSKTGLSKMEKISGNKRKQHPTIIIF